MMNKSLVTNLAALVLALSGFLMPGRIGEVVQSMGLFAVSGALTNWLAIYMLFERVPGFYGSGVIPARFSEFKVGIRELVMQQFFNPDNIRQFFSKLDAGQQAGPTALVDGIVSRVDYNKAFDALIDVIKQSSFSGMLNMLGGTAVLQPLREPFGIKMQEFLQDLGKDPDLMQHIGRHSATGLLARVELIVDARLDELTPQLVKEIIQQMIQKHLGWLVVWGGVVGGLIGLLAALLG
jgi:uncharacterized membrane-anchored protein YjiN (DUF445 family)